MASGDEREYVLGTNRDELVRLGFQHRVWSRYAFDLWERAGFTRGQTILDLGCGPGYTSVDLAHITGPDGRVIAIDVSENFITHLNTLRQANEAVNIDARVCSAEQLDLEPNSVDRAYARWLLCFVADPQTVVANVAKALRPGGVFAVQDYYNYKAITLAPESRAFRRMIQAVDASWRKPGGDPDICTRLPTILADCGLKIREVKPLVRMGQPGSLIWQWPETFFRIFGPALVEKGEITEEERRAFDADWEEHSKNPNAFFATPPMCDIIAVKS